MRFTSRRTLAVICIIVSTYTSIAVKPGELRKSFIPSAQPLFVTGPVKISRNTISSLDPDVQTWTQARTKGGKPEVLRSITD